MDKHEVKKIRADLAGEITEVESALFEYHENLRTVTEEGLIDYYAYIIKAYEAKHRYLLGKIKEVF